MFLTRMPLAGLVLWTGILLFCPWHSLRAQESNEPFSAAQIDFFENKVRPILIEHCLECHGAKPEKLRGGLRLTSRREILDGGDSGPVVVPGKPDDSLFMSAVHYEDFEMPPTGQLSQRDIEILAEWIRMGLPDPRQPGTSGVQAGLDWTAAREHWAFQPRQLGVSRPTDRGSQESIIDQYVIARLNRDNDGKRPFQLSPPAPRETLIRRLHLTLVGLPPTIEEIESFTTVEERVDQLLASPRFGERWGRHWLDVARFAESSGGGRSLMFPDAWRYRDYVIQAFNRDKPFDQFVKEQVAGDLLPADSIAQRNEQVVATGFLALGPTNYEQQDKEGLVIDVVDEQIDTVGRAFLGLTLGCARCHDHKFDPITTREYYALAGIFKSTATVVHSNVSKYVETSIASPEELKQQKDHRLAVKRITAELAKAKGEVEALGGQIPSAANVKKSLPAARLPGLVIDNVATERVGQWQESQFSGTFVDAGYIHDQNRGKGKKKVIFTPRFNVGGQYEVRMAYTAGGNRASNVPVLIDHQDGQARQLVNQSKTPPIDGLFISLGRFRFEADNVARVTIETGGTDGHVIVDAIQFLPLDQVPDVAAETEPGDLADKSQGSVPETDQALQAALKNYRQLDQRLKVLKEKTAPPVPVAMSVRDIEKPADSPIHIRGEVRNLGPTVPRGFLDICNHVLADNDSPDLHGSADRNMATRLPRASSIPAGQSGRLQLAEWLVHPEHPLTARVYVHRVWRHLFGVGLVESTDNFGLMGTAPVNRELLDYLAEQLIENGWSTKSLIRQITASRTYQQHIGHELTAEGSPAREDLENRLLWRFNRQRLDAEVLRDSILAVSGQLDLTPGGRTIRKMAQYDLGYEFDTRRRSVYVPAFRNSMLDLFEVFDVANPNLVTGHRVTSTLPTQSLFLMNSPMVIESARIMAGKILEEPLAPEAAGPSGQVRWLYRTMLGRPPTKEEAEESIRFLSDFQPDTDSLTPRQDAWQNLIHALFCSLEFRYMD
ncbi:MAG: DUF1553 domain-containing protein [Planctomycetota bacterium]|nr:DUF1553 domain-containing protein [Planctomycetota bacterium]